MNFLSYMIKTTLLLIKTFANSKYTIFVCSITILQRLNNLLSTLYVDALESDEAEVQNFDDVRER